MTSSMASYEQLVRQVEALKAENTHLRQELRDNSSHLSKLETETSGMKVRACTEGIGQKDRLESADVLGELRVGSPRHVDWQGDRCVRVPATLIVTALFPTMAAGGPETPSGQAGAGGESAGVFRADRSVRATER